MKFGLMSDLHLDIMHDGPDRLNQFLKACQEEQVDFIINNGDFCYPKDTSKCLCSEEGTPVNLKNAMRVSTPIPKLQMLEKFNQYPKPHYHVLGNHEMDFCSKEEAMELYGMPGAYYDFHENGWHFLVLDPNHFQNEKGEICDYYYGNYFDYRDKLPFLDEGQLQWMKRVIMECPEPVVMFSHQPLIPMWGGLRNSDQFQQALDEMGEEHRQKVKMCVYGHVHLDDVSEDRGIIQYSINSMSNYWIGEEYARHRYSDDIEEKFPNLQYVFPYQDPLFAIVTMDADGVTIKGKEGQFVAPAPKETGFYDIDLTASVKDRYVKWPR